MSNTSDRGLLGRPILNPRSDVSLIPYPSPVSGEIVVIMIKQVNRGNEIMCKPQTEIHK